MSAETEIARIIMPIFILTDKCKEDVGGRSWALGRWAGLTCHAAAMIGRSLTKKRMRESVPL